MVTTRVDKTIIELRKIFFTHGLPEQIVTDNGAQFISELFEQFLQENGIKHIQSAPYHPSTNGETKRFVQTFKNAMKAAKNDSVSFDTKLARFLIMYCSTSNTTTGESPAGLLFHCQLHTRHSLSVSTTVDSKQTHQKSHHAKKSKDRRFEMNQPVLVQNYNGETKWVPGTILSRLGPRNYKVLVDGKVWK